MEGKNEATTTKINGARLGLITFGMLLGSSLAGIDETIVATAMDSIAKDLRATDQVTWIASAYMLGATAAMPLYGRLADIYGRRAMIWSALFLFLVGSVGCGLASSVLILIIARGISGIGAAGLIALPYIIISDVVPLEKRGPFLGSVESVFALSNVIGPLLGGIMADHYSWRWVFYINIPLAVICLSVSYLVIPFVGEPEEIKVDYLGAITMFMGTVLLVLGLSWGGQEYPWTSYQVILPLIFGSILLMAFVFVELRVASSPIIPGHIFNRNVVCANLVSASVGFPFFVIMYYWPLYHQHVHNASATHAGLGLIPFLLGVTLISVLSGFVVSKLGSYKPLMCIGMTLLLIGCSWMARLTPGIKFIEEVAITALLGAGVGMNIQATVVASQANVNECDVSIVSSFSSFTLSFGGILGLAIQGAVFTNFLDSSPTDEISTEMYIQAYRITFLSLIPFVAIGLITVVVFLRHVPLK